MDRYTYNCSYCGVEYTPRRRRIQKYCSNSCRVNAFNQKKKIKQLSPKFENPKMQTTKDKMSWSGIGNAAVGTLATNMATSLFTKEENKPATKGDIQKLLSGSVQKLILIKNLSPQFDGSRAYFDTQQQIIIYK